jgi:hypothetical protein
MTQRLTGTSLLLIASVALSSQAYGGPIVRALFTAEVESIFDDADLLSGQVSVGQSGSGFFEYDAGMPNQTGDPDFGEYGPPSDFHFELGGYTFQMDVTSPQGRIVIVNDQFYFGDTFHWRSSNNVDDVPGDFTIFDAVMELRQFEADGATVFSNSDLPTSLTLEPFSEDNRFFSIEFGPGFQQVINLNVTAISTEVVPEPSSFTLFLMGTLGLLARARRRTSAIPPVSTRSQGILTEAVPEGGSEKPVEAEDWKRSGSV